MLKLTQNLINQKKQELDDWYRSKLDLVTPCFYSSIDLRYSGAKLAPVDTNLFPAGFNNLDRKNFPKATQLIKEYLQNFFPLAKKIILIGEDHQRNLYYLDNLKTLEELLILAGFEVKLANVNTNITLKLKGNTYQDIDIHPITKNENSIAINDFVADLIILNNDLSKENPEILKNIKQPIIPHPNNGWFLRRKSNHFRIYNNLLEELESLFNIPAFLFTTEFDICDNINFKTMTGIETLAIKLDQLLLKIQEKYERYKITNKPYVVIKSDYGTYGMGVMIAKSSQDVYNLNKKLRNQMHITKSNIINEQVILQEGIKTIDKIDNASAEPLLYFINHQEVEFLYRLHQGKDEYSNLNSVGMEIASNYKAKNKNYHYLCNFVARIATLAAALELV